MAARPACRLRPDDLNPVPAGEAFNGLPVERRRGAHPGMDGRFGQQYEEDLDLWELLKTGARLTYATYR